MYNEIQKQAYIDSKADTTKKFLLQIFNGFEPYEKKWNMDLSMQSTDILQPVVNELSGLRSKSTELLLIMLKDYVKWCGQNGYETSRGIYGVRIDSIEKVRNQMVSSPAHLATILCKEKVKDDSGKVILERGFDDPEKETIDVTYRVFLWMAFAGLYDIEAIRVKSSDVDLENLKIDFEGHSYEIYKEAIVDFNKACNLNEFVYEHPHYTIKRQRVDGSIIMRGVRSNKVDLMTLRPIINKKLNPKQKGDNTRLKTKISYNKIYLSGAFYRAFIRERMGIPVNFSDLVAKDMKNSDYKITATRTLNTIANKLEREYLADYEKWKCAFDV